MSRVRRTSAVPAAHTDSVRLRGGRRVRPVPITGAAPSLSEDLGGRMRRYWLLMGLRVACMASMFVVPRGWWWVCIAGALVAPLLAVLVANAGREGGGPTATERQGQDLVVLDRPDGLGQDAGSEDGSHRSGAAPRRAPTYRVRPGEYLR